MGGLAHGMFALLSSVGAVNSCGGDTHPGEEEWDQVVEESGEPLLPSQRTNFCFNCDEKDGHCPHCSHTCVPLTRLIRRQRRND